MIENRMLRILMFTLLVGISLAPIGAIPIAIGLEALGMAAPCAVLIPWISITALAVGLGIAEDWQID